MQTKNLEVDIEIDDKPLWNVIAGMFGYQTLMVANEIDLFSKFPNSSTTITEISEILGLNERVAKAILIMLANIGLVDYSNNKYSLTKYAKKYLIKDSPTYFGGLLELTNLNTIESLKNAVLSNESRVYGEEAIFESHEKQIETAKSFTRAMHSSSMAPALAWPKHVDLSNSKIFLDIGGGSGAHIIGVLSNFKNLNAINFEIPPVCEVSDEFLNIYALGDRASSHPGDFWKDEYPESDIHFYSQIFHDWPIDKCKFLSNKSFESLPSKGKVLIHEILFNDEKTGPLVAAAGSVAMLNWTEGKQYSGKEITEILKDSGFLNISIINTFGYWSLIVAEKP